MWRLVLWSRFNGFELMEGKVMIMFVLFFLCEVKLKEESFLQVLDWSV